MAVSPMWRYTPNLVESSLVLFPLDRLELSSNPSILTHAIDGRMRIRFGANHMSSNSIGPSLSSLSPLGAPNLSDYLPFLISGNIRLHHRAGNDGDTTNMSTSMVASSDSPYSSFPPSVVDWIRSCFIRQTPSQPTRTPPHSLNHASHETPILAYSGNILLGDYYPNPNESSSIVDYSGRIHILRPSPHPQPIRILAVLGTRDSVVHCNGGLYDPITGDSISHLSIYSGQELYWLGESSGIIGHLLGDAPRRRVLTVESSNADSDSDQMNVAFIPKAAKFIVTGLVYDATTHQPVHIRSLAPSIPKESNPALALTTTLIPSFQSSISSHHDPPLVPRIILIGSSSSTCGKTTLASSIIFTLHSLHQSDVESDSPHLKIAFIKASGSGSRRDILEIENLRLSDGFTPAVVRAYDHVDVGLISTYGNNSTQIDQFKRCVEELIALGSVPHRSPSGQNTPIDYIVIELGSDLISAHNPILINLPTIREHLFGLFTLTSDALSLLGVCNYIHGTLKLPPSKSILVNSHTYNYTGMASRIKGSGVKLYQHSHTHLQQAVTALQQIWSDERRVDHHKHHRSSDGLHSPSSSPSSLSLTSAALVDASPPSSSTASSGTSSPHATTETHFHLPIGVIKFPPTNDDTNGAISSEVCQELLLWVVESSDIVDGYSRSMLDELDIDSADIGTLASAVTKDVRFQSSLNFQFLQRKRDRIRTKRQEQGNQQQASHDGKDSLHPKSTMPPSTHLLALGDYVDSPYYIPRSPQPPPDHLAGALLASDSSLGWLRRLMVPARVKEEIFWQTYFDALYERVKDYVQARLNEITRRK